MCVIVYKDHKTTIDYDTLNMMWKSNPHGAGIAYYDDIIAGKIRIEKGFMKFEDLLSALQNHRGRDLVIHFRFATHGKITPEQTHPFTITKQPMDTKAYNPNRLYDNALFHNGVISGYGNDKISDTIDFVSSTLAEIPKLKTRIDVLSLTYDSYILMDNSEFYFIGNFEEYKGLECSNLNFLPMKFWKNSNKGANIVSYEESLHSKYNSHAFYDKWDQLPGDYDDLMNDPDGINDYCVEELIERKK